MRPTTGRLMKMLLKRISTTPASPNMQGAIEVEFKSVEKVIEALDVRLGELEVPEGQQRYFGGELSIVDILYYTEISTLIFLSGK